MSDDIILLWQKTNKSAHDKEVKFVNLVVLSQNCKFQRKPRNLETDISQLRSPKSSSLASPPDQHHQQSKVRDSYHFITHGYLKKNNSVEIKVLFGRCVFFLIHFSFMINKKVHFSPYFLSLAQLSLCLSMPDYMYQLNVQKWYLNIS